MLDLSGVENIYQNMNILNKIFFHKPVFTFHETLSHWKCPGWFQKYYIFIYELTSLELTVNCQGPVQNQTPTPYPCVLDGPCSKPKQTLTTYVLVGPRSKPNPYTQSMGPSSVLVQTKPSHIFNIYILVDDLIQSYLMSACIFILVHRGSQTHNAFMLYQRSMGLSWLSLMVLKGLFSNQTITWKDDLGRKARYWIWSGIRSQEILSRDQNCQKMF